MYQTSSTGSSAIAVTGSKAVRHVRTQRTSAVIFEKNASQFFSPFFIRRMPSSVCGFMVAEGVLSGFDAIILADSIGDAFRFHFLSQIAAKMERLLCQ
jgi:hypothetical protein